MIESAVARLETTKIAIARVASDCDRDPAGVTLIAVSKTFPADDIIPLLNIGQRVFGENYVQETKAKWPALRLLYPDLDLHMIGPVQSNKAGEAVALFDAIHTVDRDSLAAALAKEIRRQNRKPRLLVQVNTGAEPQKGGVLPVETTAFVMRCREVHGLEISGLMCIPPFDQTPSPHFALLKQLALQLDLPQLSMGMSADFGAAIQLGATHVRVGSAIFGSR